MGGRIGYQPTPEVRQRLRQAARGNRRAAGKRTAEQRHNISEGMKAYFQRRRERIVLPAKKAAV